MKMLITLGSDIPRSDMGSAHTDGQVSPTTLFGEDIAELSVRERKKNEHRNDDLGEPEVDDRQVVL